MRGKSPWYPKIPNLDLAQTFLLEIDFKVPSLEKALLDLVEGRLSESGTLGLPQMMLKTEACLYLLGYNHITIPHEHRAPRKKQQGSTGTF